MISEDGSSPLCMKAEENSEITSCIKHKIDFTEKVEEEPIIIQANTATADNHSSSTEGPDSPAHSTSSSPLGVMIPAYPDHPEFDDGDEDKPLLPLFAVKFGEEASKDGDAIRYSLKVKKLSVGSDSDETLSIEREYDDFEFLHHVLTTNNQILGLIVPPLPPRPAVDPKAAETRSQKQLGSTSKAMMGDDFVNDARHLERYMHQMLRHPVFGRDKHIEEFLVHRNAPIRAKIRKGFLAGVKESFDRRSTSSIRDPDDFFQKEKEWALAYGSVIKDVCDRFSGLSAAKLRLSNQVTHLSVLLNASVGGQENPNNFYNRLNSRFSSCLQDCEVKSIEASVDVDDITLGSYLSQWSDYVEAENAMLHRRTTLVIDTDSATKALIKAKPAKAHEARRVKDEKDKQLEQVSKKAELEVRRFHHQRLSELKSSLVSYAEGQLKVAKENHKALSDCAQKLREFPLPHVNASSLSRPE